MHTDIALFLFILQLVIFLYFILVNGFLTVSTFIALLDIRGQLSIASQQYIRDLIVTGVYYRPISILVPAYNEETTIVASLRATLGLHFPEYEVIVVNDGSSDRTLELLKAEFKLARIERPLKITLKHEQILGLYVSPDYPHLLVIDKNNGGKADALNAGINASQFPLVCSVDADSLLDDESLVRVSKLFVEDRKVIAAGGIVRMLNGCTVENNKIVDVFAPRKMIECFQSVEYLRGFLVGRTSWNFANNMLIISGAFGLFRKDILLAIDGYRKTVGEDMDIIVRMHRHCIKNKIPRKVVFVPDPVCWTQVPGDYGSLLKQRNRWHRGLIETLWHNRGMTLNPRYGSIGLFAFPYYLFVEGLGPLVEFFGYVFFAILFLMGMITRDLALLFLLLSVAWGMSLNMGAILLDNLMFRRYKRLRDLLKISLFAFLEYAGYRQLLVVERIIATLFLVRRDWGKPKRELINNDNR